MGESEAVAAVMQALPAGSSMQKMPAGRGTATGKSRNIIQMFHGIAGAATLLSETTGGNGLKSRLQSCDGAEGGAETIAVAAKYDLILHTRPDLCLCEPLDLHQVHDDAATTVHVPWFNLWQDRSPPACNYAFDQMALGRTAPMMRYANGFSSVCKEVTASKELSVDQLSVCVSILESTFCVCVSICGSTSCVCVHPGVNFLCVCLSVDQLSVCVSILESIFCVCVYLWINFLCACPSWSQLSA